MDPKKSCCMKPGPNWVKGQILFRFSQCAPFVFIKFLLEIGFHWNFESSKMAQSFILFFGSLFNQENNQWWIKHLTLFNILSKISLTDQKKYCSIEWGSSNHFCVELHPLNHLRTRSVFPYIFITFWRTNFIREICKRIFCFLLTSHQQQIRQHPRYWKKYWDDE